jgi:fructan beta-fructosidase
MAIRLQTKQINFGKLFLPTRMFRIVFLLTLLTGSLPALTQPDYRPLYHFTPPQNWINDPNGLVFYDGEYHLFYQHNPFANQWGHMSWGHAVSRDLLRWQHLPVAIPEFTHTDLQTGLRQVQTAIFSGSSLIDRGNRSGICPPGTRDCMVAIYTGNVTAGSEHISQYQNMAYSTDRGRTWTQYPRNPIIDIGSKEFRDPNVFWYEPQQKWVMAVVKATEHRMALYESKDLKTWQLMSHFGPAADTSKVWECPALVQVPVQNEPGKSKWVLFISAGHPQAGYVGMQYFVGNFDGREFRPDAASPKPAIANGFPGSVVDWGKDYYAAIPYNDLPPTPDGKPARGGPARPVMIGWLNNWAYAGDLPTTPFKGAMSLPRQISLRRERGEYQLIQQPISEVTRLRGDRSIQRFVQLKNQTAPLEQTTTNAYELELEITPLTAKTAGIRLAKGGNEETVIQYTADGQLQLDRRRSGNVAFSKAFPSVESAPLSRRNGAIKLRIFVDKSVIEIYANDGARVLTDQIFPTNGVNGIELFSEGGTALFRNVSLWQLKKP